MTTEKKQTLKRKRFFVAEKREVGTKRGQLKAGAEVFAKDFPGGEKTIRELVENVKSLVEK